ncbi:MAG: dihydropyrimidinase [Chloroflexi bacterium]|nr:MAG: dihydropyrimidinase [Chloroflexota bacterium]
MGILFQGGTIITATEMVQADLLVEGETIALIGQNLDPTGHEVVNCAGKYLMPGGIDVHTHLDLPFGATSSNDDFDIGHMAAAFGGTTTHIDFATQRHGETLAQGLEKWWRKSEGIAQIDYSFHMQMTDPRDDVLDEIPSLLDEGITTLKLFLAYKTMYQISDAEFFRVMQRAAEHGMMVMVHAENGDVEDILRPALIAQGKTEPYWHAHSRPPEIEGEATNRAIMMAALSGCPLYVVHMTCQQSVEALRRGRAQGYPVMGETCTQYFFLTAEHLGLPDFEGAKYVCSPPLRTEDDQETLWQAIQDGTLQVVSTDHCDFWFEGGRGPWQEWAQSHPNGDWTAYERQNPDYRRPGKELGRERFDKIPNGLPGIEDRMLVMWEAGVNGKRISPMKFVELHCTNPAKIFGMYPRKGTLMPGSDADILVWDPDAEHIRSAATHHMRCDYNVYEGMRCRGKPVQVYLRGRKIVDGDRWLGENGYGQFIKRQPNAPIL